MSTARCSLLPRKASLIRSMTGSNDRTCGRASAVSSSGPSSESGSGDDAPARGGRAAGAMPRRANDSRSSVVASSPANQLARDSVGTALRVSSASCTTRASESSNRHSSHSS